jgi:hypothetical protein
MTAKKTIGSTKAASLTKPSINPYTNHTWKDWRHVFFWLFAIDGFSIFIYYIFTLLFININKIAGDPQGMQAMLTSGFSGMIFKIYMMWQTLLNLLITTYCVLFLTKLAYDIFRRKSNGKKGKK